MIAAAADTTIARRAKAARKKWRAQQRAREAGTVAPKPRASSRNPERAQPPAKSSWHGPLLLVEDLRGGTFARRDDTCPRFNRCELDWIAMHRGAMVLGAVPGDVSDFAGAGVSKGPSEQLPHLSTGGQGVHSVVARGGQRPC